MIIVDFHQTNVIEASPDMQRSSEKEWYFGNAEKERLGPYSFEEVHIVHFFHFQFLFVCTRSLHHEGQCLSHCSALKHTYMYIDMHTSFIPTHACTFKHTHTHASMHACTHTQTCTDVCMPQNCAFQCHPSFGHMMWIFIPSSGLST